METIVIASKNPVKIKATEQAFARLFPNRLFEFMGVSVPSEVSDQPMTDHETFKGAFNRTKNAMKEIPEASFWVGIEGGVEKKGHEMEAFAWVYIESDYGMVGKARTGSFLLPKEIVYLVDQGIELGKADDILFAQENSKQQGGSVGILTKGVLNRTEYYEQAVVLAFIPLFNEKLYR